MSDVVSQGIRAFVTDHGGAAKAVLQPVGLRGVRVTLVGEDGIMGDEMVESMAAARALVDAVPGLTEATWDRDLTALATPAAGHARKMAGRYARTA